MHFQGSLTAGHWSKLVSLAAVHDVDCVSTCCIALKPAGSAKKFVELVLEYGAFLHLQNSDGDAAFMNEYSFPLAENSILNIEDPSRERTLTSDGSST